MKVFRVIVIIVLAGGIFSGGFYVGARSTLDEEIAKKIAEPFQSYQTLSLKGFNLKASSDELELLFLIQNGEKIDMYIDAQRELITDNIKKLEDALNDYSGDSDKTLFINEINRARKLLAR